MKLLLKIIGKLIKWSAVIFGVLFTIYMLNLDMKLVGWLYKCLNKFHDRAGRRAGCGLLMELYNELIRETEGLLEGRPLHLGL